MTLLKNRPLLVAMSLVAICSLSAAAFLGCSPSAGDKPSQATPPKDNAPVKPTDDPAAPAEKPADQPSEPKATLVEPVEKLGFDAPAMPAPPKVSTFAPAVDLANQADWYIKDLESAVADQEEYMDSVDKIANESNTLVVIALALGLHDQESKYKTSAGALIQAAQAVAATKDFESAKKAIAALKDAAKDKGQAGGELKWEKIASLPELMNQVPVVNTKLKLNLKPKKFKKKAKLTSGYTAVIATIAQGSMANTSASNSADQVKQWYDFSVAMRDEAGALNAAIHKGDQDAAAKAMKRLTQSCDDCHAVFHPAEVGN